MTAILMDGKRVAGEILAAAEQRVAKLKQATGVTPCLATILVGADPASITYTQMKRRRCEGIGMISRKIELPTETTTEQLLLDVVGTSQRSTASCSSTPAPNTSTNAPPLKPSQ